MPGRRLLLCMDSDSATVAGKAGGAPNKDALAPGRAALGCARKGASGGTRGGASPETGLTATARLR